MTDLSTSLPKSLARVKRGNLCSGCGGCSLVTPQKIKMRYEDPGYLRPEVITPLTPDEDDRIEEICPGLQQHVQVGSRLDHVLWGPYIEMRTGFATDPELRFTGSSGAVLSAALIHLLDTGAVDEVIQNSADKLAPLANLTTHSNTPKQVLNSAGSRYAPSSPLAQIAPLLDNNKRYAFVGKPCDVAALRALAELDNRINDRIPFMLSFFCAGVPSLKGGKEILKALDVPPEEVESFRYRGNGWPGYATASLKSGDSRSMSYHESWGGILSKHVQHRCKICADGTGTAADLVCADAWESDEAGYPVFEEQDGISLVVARTEKGHALLEALKQSKAITTSPFDVSTLAAIQPGQTKRRQALLARLSGLKLLAKPTPRYTGLHLFSASRQNDLNSNLRNFLGMVRRGLLGRIRS